MAEAYRKLLKKFKKRSLLERVFLVVFLLGFVIYGGTKPGARMMRRKGDARDFTAEERERGVVKTYVRSGEAWNFDPPPGATIIEKWKHRGGADDVHKATLNNSPVRIFASGGVSFNDCVFQLLNCPIGVVPEGNWSRINKSNATSRVWYKEEDDGKLTVTWQDALLNRDGNRPVSFRAEISPNGLTDYRYDLSQAGECTNLFAALGRNCKFPIPERYSARIL